METINQINPVKSLLVLTDFSQSAKNAANYALNLALRIKANLVLFNAYSIPDVDIIPGRPEPMVIFLKKALTNLGKKPSDYKIFLAITSERSYQNAGS